MDQWHTEKKLENYFTIQEDVVVEILEKFEFRIFTLSSKEITTQLIVQNQQDKH